MQQPLQQQLLGKLCPLFCVSSLSAATILCAAFAIDAVAAAAAAGLEAALESREISRQLIRASLRENHRLFFFNEMQRFLSERKFKEYHPTRWSSW